MPFTKHIDYGPDKLPAKIASKDGHQLETAWVGTLMYGPFAMTATDITNWTEATLNIDSRSANRYYRKFIYTNARWTNFPTRLLSP